MNCNDVAAILDSNRSAHMTAAERATVDVHLSTCEDCDAAWHGQTELMALRVPAMPATLLERALRAARVPPVAQPRHAFRPIAIGATLLAGAALASMTIVSLTDSPSAGIPPSAAGEPSAQVDAALVDAAPTAATPAATATPDLPTSVELVETSDADVIPLVRHNPQYPPRALEQGAEGYVQLEFDITAAGAVENVSVVKSDDAQFEQSAIDALSKWRYLPRLVAGKRVGRNGVQTIIRFALDGAKSPPAAPTPRQQEKIDAAIREGLAYSAGLEVALDRLAADDLRGVELQLDEMQAVYGAERLDLWNFYGYLYTVEGNYSRAIDAYETAVAVAMRSPYPTSGPYVSLATLYFARHQYDLALKTLLRPQQAFSGNPAGRSWRVSNEATALIERLRALGVTEETLLGR
jgi:TonB family protein